MYINTYTFSKDSQSSPNNLIISIRVPFSGGANRNKIIELFFLLELGIFFSD